MSNSQVLAGALSGGPSAPWATEPAPQLQPSLITGTMHHLGDILSIMQDSNNTLIETRQRLFGPWPTSASATGLKEASSGQADDLNDLIVRVRNMAYDLRDNASSLNSAL